MRFRWIVFLFLLGMIVALCTHSLIGGYITLFGCAILHAIRRLENAMGHQHSTIDHATLEAHLVMEPVVALHQELSRKGMRTSIFAGDTSPMSIEPEARKSIAKQ